MSNDIKKLLESIDSINQLNESRYKVISPKKGMYQVVIASGEQTGKVMFTTKDPGKAERYRNDFQKGYDKSKAGREEEWAKREKSSDNSDPQIKIESEDLDEQNDFPRQAMDYGTGMKPHQESEHAGMDSSNFENDPRWAEYDKLQSRQQFTQARDLMNRMRYEHHMDESIEEGSLHNGTYYDTHIDNKMYDMGVTAFKNYLKTGKKVVPEFKHRDQKTSFDQGWSDAVLKKKSNKTESVESVEENVKWNSFHKWYDSSPKDVVSRARKADTNFLKNVIEVDPRDLGGAAKLQWMAARKELQRRGEMVPESFNAKGKDDMINESMWDEDVGTDPVVICMHKDGHKMYFKEFHSNGNYYWTANKDEARDFESEDAATDAIKMIKAHDPAVYKMGLVGKTHGEKPYPIYAEPMHEMTENFAEPAGSSPLTHGIDNVNTEFDMEEDWSADEYNRQKMIDAPKSRQHNPVSAPGKHSYIPRSHELEEENDNGEDEIIQDLSGKLAGPWPLGGTENGMSSDSRAARNRVGRRDSEDERQTGQIDRAMSRQAGMGEDSPMQADPDSVIEESSAPGQEAWIKANKSKFVKEYGKKKGLEVLYATAWRRSKGQGKKGVKESAPPFNWKVWNQGQDDYEKHGGNMKNPHVGTEWAMEWQMGYDDAAKEASVKQGPGRKLAKKVFGRDAVAAVSPGTPIKGNRDMQHFESMFAEAMEDKPMKNKKSKQINESFDLTDSQQTKSIVDSLGSMMKLAGLQSQKAEYKPYVAESEGDVFSRMKDYFDIESPESEEDETNSGSGEDNSGSGEEYSDDSGSGDNCDSSTEVDVVGSSAGDGHFSGLADKIKNLATGKEPGKHFGGLADKLNAMKDGEVDEERETPDFKGIGDKLRNHFKKPVDEDVGNGASVAVHKAYPGKVNAIKSDLQKYHSNNGADIPSTQQGDYVHFHLPAAGHNSADAVKRTLQGHEGHPAYSPENVSEGINEDLSATLTMSKTEDGKSMSLTITDQHGDELDKLLCLSGIAQPQAVAVISTQMEPSRGEAPEQAEGGYQGAYEMVGEADEQYSDPDREPTGEYGDTHTYSNNIKPDVYDLDTQINKGSDLNAPKGEYAKEFPGDNRMDTAKRDAAYESKEVAEGWMDKFNKVAKGVNKAIGGYDKEKIDAQRKDLDTAERRAYEKGDAESEALSRITGWDKKDKPSESVAESKLWKEYKGIK